MRNAGWLFYRNYYDWLEKPGGERYLQHFDDTGKLAKDKDVLFKEESRALTDFGFETGLNDFFPVGNQHFELETTYPGLLVGSGYSHQTGAMGKFKRVALGNKESKQHDQTGATGEFKLGFFFDHCTGLPVIPGSSVKGLLRSAFPNREKQETVQQAKTAFVQSLLTQIRPELVDLPIDQLEELLFSGKTESGDYLPMYEHDVFLDAHIIGTRNEGKRIFGEDYLTPHPNPLKNPIPVRFLKILPKVRFRFNFNLQPSTLTGLTLYAADKEHLFRIILEQLGIGAKTNVGYGQFFAP